MSIIRSRIAFEDHFTQLPNAWMRDTRLSRRARGFLAELMTHREGWVVSVASLVRGGPEGREATMKALQELEEFGYLQRKQQKVDGRFSSTDYIITDPGPWSDLPTTETPTAGNPSSGNPDTKKNISKKTTSKKTNTKTSGAADADAGDDVIEAEVIEDAVEVKAGDDPKPWAVIAKRAYDSTAGALPFMGVQGIAKWAIEKRGAAPADVESVIAGLYRSGQAVTKQSVGQVLDGFRNTSPRGQSAVERRVERNAQIADQWLAKHDNTPAPRSFLEIGFDQ